MPKHRIAELSERLVESVLVVWQEARAARHLNNKNAAEQATLSPQMIGYLDGGERLPSLLCYMKLSLGMEVRPSALLAAAEERVGLDKLPGLSHGLHE